MLKLVLLVVFFVLSSAFSHADRVMRILYYGAPADAPKSAFMYQKGQEVQEVPLPKRIFSKSFALSEGDLSVSFLPTPLAEDAEMPAGAPVMNVPKDWEKVIVLVFPDPDNPIMPIRLQALNASDDVFAPGELMFINFSKVSIFGLVGEQKLLVHPEAIKIVSNPIPERGEYQVRLDSVKDDKESRRWVMRQTWRHQPNVRRVVFVMPLPAPRVAKLYSAALRKF